MSLNHNGSGWLVRAVSWTGALLFGAALVYCVRFYAVTLGQAAGEPASAVNAAIDAGLFAVFAAHHSFFARRRAKRWIASRLSPELERPVYVWCASVLLVLACAAWRPIGGSAWHVEGAGTWVLYGLQLAGGVITLVSARVISVRALAGVPCSRPPDTGPTVFKTSGPYGWVRHPIYLGWVLLVFAAPAMTVDRLAFAIISSGYLVMAIPLEERSLVEEHGASYRAYQSAVPWRLVPGVW